MDLAVPIIIVKILLPFYDYCLDIIIFVCLLTVLCIVVLYNYNTFIKIITCFYACMVVCICTPMLQIRTFCLHTVIGESVDQHSTIVAVPEVRPQRSSEKVHLNNTILIV